jgi:TRAP-type transport system periplasmic protein
MNRTTSNSARRRIPAIAGGVAVACLLAACGGSDQEGAGGGGDSVETVTLRAGVIYNPSVPIVRCGLEPLAEDEGLAAAGVEIQTTDSSQLGAENELLEQASSGELDIALAAGSTLATVFGIPQLEMFEAYYLYDSVEDIQRVRETEVADAAWGVLADEANLEAVGTPWLYGERHVFGNTAVRGPDDFEGLKLRVPATDISIASAQALGASPTPTAYAELYLAIQQGIVDAAEAPLSVIAAESFDEPSSYINLTGHLISAASPLINGDTWASLSADQQEAVEVAFGAVAEDIAACVAEDDAAAVEEWESTGSIEIVDDVDREALAELAEAAYSEGFPWSEDYVALLDELDG